MRLQDFNLPDQMLNIDLELERLLHLQQDIEAQMSFEKGRSMQGEIDRGDYEQWKGRAMVVKKRAVRRYKELKDLKKETNIANTKAAPSENIIILRDILDTLLDIREAMKAKPQAEVRDE